jgi:hypothetical protein
MKQALRGEPLTVYGDGSQTRSFCYVSDEVDGFLRLAKSDEHLPVNIGNPNEFTMIECAQQVLKVTGIEKQNRLRTPAPGRSQTAPPDITKARTLLGWEPSNLTINVTNPTFGCYTGEFWAVSQAAPVRRVLVNGAATLMDYCTGPSYASGGFIADSQFEGWQHRQWLAAAMDHPQQHHRWLEQRRLEPGILRRRGRARPVFPRASRHAVGPTPRSPPARSRARRHILYRTLAAIQRLRACGATQLLGNDVGQRPDARLIHFNPRDSSLPSRRIPRSTINRALIFRQEPHPYPRHL